MTETINSIVYGVNRSALLDILDYIDVTTGAFIPDITHNILEGVLPQEINKVR